MAGIFNSHHSSCSLSLPPVCDWHMPRGFTLSSNYVECPFCYKNCHWQGGGVANHIWKSPFCCKRQHQTLEMLTRQGEEDPCTTAPGSSTPPNSQPGGHDLDHSPSDHIDTFDPENHTGNQWFEVHLEEETAGFGVWWELCTLDIKGRVGTCSLVGHISTVTQWHQ